MLRKLSSTLKVGLALFVAIFSNSLLPTVTAYAATSTGSSTELTSVEKPWICHPVNGAGELGNGWNLIDPDHASSHIDESKYPDGTYWKHESNDGRHDMYATSDKTCPGGSVTALAPSVKADPCGTTEDTYTIPAKTGVVYKVGGVTKVAGDYSTGGALSITVTAVAASGYTLTGTNSWPLTFTNTSCTQTTTTPSVTPSVVCGANNDTLVLANTAAYTVSSDSGWVMGSRTVTWATTANYVFTGGGTTYTQTFTDYNTICPPTEISLPTPTLNDPCGLNNAMWAMVQPTTDHITWSVVNGELIATISGNYKFPDGKTTHNYGKAIDSNKRCEVAIPVAPMQNDPCGINNASWMLPDDTAQLDWSLTNGILSVQTKSDYVFTDQSTQKSFGYAKDSGVLCDANPVTPQFTDLCGKRNDIVVKPNNTSMITYTLMQKGQTWVITATPSANYQLKVGETGYVLQENGTATWTKTLSDKKCDKVEICHRDNNVNKPYGPKRIEVSANAVDSEGNSDHMSHTGPIATSKSYAQYLKDHDMKWGDIIPAVPGVTDGLNWNEQGQAIWNNDCQYVKDQESTVTVTSLQECVEYGKTGSIKVTVSNPNSTSSMYRISVDNGAYIYVTVAAGTSKDTVIDSLNVGSHNVKVQQRSGVMPEMEDVLLRNQLSPESQMQYFWNTIYNKQIMLTQCPLTEVMPQTPQISDVCGTDKDTFTLPTTSGITYTSVKNGNVLTVTTTANPGFELSLDESSKWMMQENGTATWTFTFTNESCGQVLGDTDVCPNIQGSQTMVPVGFTKNTTTGECGAVLGLGGAGAAAATPVSAVLPATLPATGNVSFLAQWLPFIAAILTYGFVSLSQRKQRA